MSETTTATPPVESTPAAPAAPEYIPTHVLSSDPEPEAQPEPGTAAAEPEKPVEPPKPEKTAEEKARENERRRYARLQAERSNEKARADQLEARLRQLENPGQAPQPDVIRREDLPRVYEEMRAQERVQERVTNFHETGQAAYPDWTERCNTLVQMGADPAFSELLLEIPDGAKVTAALAEDPEEFERISGLKTERARSIALGRYSAALESKPAPVVPVSRAPAPIQPPSAGRARGEPDPNGSFDEYRRWSEKQNWDRR